MTSAQANGPTKAPSPSAVLVNALPATSSPGVLARDGSSALCTGRVNVTAQVTTAAPAATTQNGASRASRAPVPSIDAPCAA